MATAASFIRDVYGGARNSGVVFKLNKAGFTVPHNFDGADGLYPYAPLIRDSPGNLYGTTTSGGTRGNGVVLKVDTSGAETMLLGLGGRLGGTNPRAGLIRDSAGDLYGTTQDRGSSGAGVVFKVDTTGAEKLIYCFTGGADGGNPIAGLVRDSAGNFYGTTSKGGLGFGVVFKIDTTGTETVLHSFTGGADGMGPGYGSLVRDSAGNLYGTTNTGGLGYGVVFKLDTSGTETVLHSFTGSDGDAPTRNAP